MAGKLSAPLILFLALAHLDVLKLLPRGGARPSMGCRRAAW